MATTTSGVALVDVPQAAGVLLGFLTPAHLWVGPETFAAVLDTTKARVVGGRVETGGRRSRMLECRSVFSTVGDPVSMAVAAGLAIGKPVGILLLCVAAVRAGVTTLPDRVTWPMLAGGACLAGIGFTMALFIIAMISRPQPRSCVHSSPRSRAEGAIPW
jgi:hypothetical protein